MNTRNVSCRTNIFPLNLISIDTCWFRLVFECIQTWIQKNQKREAPQADFFMFPIFFQIQNIHFFMFEYIQKLPKIKEYRLKSRSMWFGEKKLLAGGFFYHFPAGGEFLHLPSYVFDLKKTFFALGFREFNRSFSVSILVKTHQYSWKSKLT